VRKIGGGHKPNDLWSQLVESKRRESGGQIELLLLFTGHVSKKSPQK
jgi:hypothetical protein